MPTAWSFDYIPLEDVKQLPRNPKDHDLGLIHTSIERWGFLEVITINIRSGKLLGGHGRVDTLTQKYSSKEPAPPGIQVDSAGKWLVPVWFVDVDEGDDLAIAIALNQATIAGGWDLPTLSEVLIEYAKQDRLEGTGFDPEDVDVFAGMFVEDYAPPDLINEPDEERGSGMGLRIKIDSPGFFAEALRTIKDVIEHHPDWKAKIVE